MKEFNANLYFKGDNEKINIEIETNFKIRNQNEVLLSFNDLYLDINRKKMSVKNIEVKLI